MPTLKLSNKCIGITLGDPSGIGPEVVTKALSSPAITKLSHYKIIGDNIVFKYYKIKQIKNCEHINLDILSPRNWKLGLETEIGAKASLAYLNKAIQLLKNKDLAAIVTAPVCKETISQIIPSFQGHTEFFSKAFHIKHVGMMFVTPHMRTVIATRHIPLNKVSTSITLKTVYDTIRLTHTSLQKYFRIKKPSLAVCGLNPHAGEGGAIGREEQIKIIPAVRKAWREKISVEGPFAADTLFIPEIARRYDAIIAMYHDQGLAPIKAMYFQKLVNLTIGLPFIRTSPAHGTAFNIAGKNQANADSMYEAIRLAHSLIS